MSINTPEEALHAFVRAFNQRNIDAIMALYESQPTMMAEPGQAVEGRTAVRETINGFLSMKPTLTLEKHKIVPAHDLALSVMKWSLTGTDPAGQPLRLEGTSADVLRQQPDGRWLFAIDNPWGTAILS